MKRIVSFWAAVMICCAMNIQAVNYCATQSWGYAGNNVTGGGNANPTFVTNESQLSTAVGKAGSVIIITQDITVTNHISSDKSNLTIMALPGKRLISNKQNKDESGILYLKGNNILIRNVIFEGPGAYDCDGWDNLCLDKATNVWVDHCDFQDGCDGNFDIKGKSDNITVTWCRFRYLKQPKAGGSGGADDHRFTNLVGSDSSDKPDDGIYNITYGYCWWDEGCKQRMTRCRNALIHYINCYWNSSVADYYIGPEKVSSYFEGCTFAGAANSAAKIWKPFNNTTNYCTFVNCTGNLPSNSSTAVSAPTYAYDQMTASAAKSMVIDSCGAGATLTVTNAGAVSSTCDGGDEPVDPEPVVVSDWWNISDDDFNGLGTIAADTEVRGLHIVATSDKAVTVEANAQSLDTLSFTHRLKLNGSGASTHRHLWFDVTGNCSVTIYLMSAKSGEDRTLNIATGSFGNVASSMTASSALTAQTYAYAGDSTRIFLYSANSGINLYGIRLAYPEAPTGIEDATAMKQAHKIIREGRLLILRDGKIYTVTGQSL